MSENKKGDPNRANQLPTLADALQLQATVELVAGRIPANTDDKTRVVAHYYPDGRTDLEEGTVISEISLSQKTKGTDSYTIVMNYRVLRDKYDETTTTVIKKPPFELPSFEETFQGHGPSSDVGQEAHAAALAGVDENLALYGLARQIGVGSDLTASEVWELGEMLERAFPDTNGSIQT